ncbi:type II secretion system protein [Mesoaciditoga lauensis]|uniref:type II secretion system protein n=1 Tax=Mesoaciditoga lauensis TaxID=1495039 RepID=UPI0006906037|nr:type II secretion system protein [Mesoaciditoga lauensis]
MRKRREGFTLVELLIVMAVIAALMGALVPVALNAIKHANATRVAENLRAISTAVQQYIYTNKPASPTDVTLNDVKTNLSGNPDAYKDYTVSVQASGTNSKTYNIWVWYNGNSPSASDVQKVWNMVTSTHTDYPAVENTITIYW